MKNIVVYDLLPLTETLLINSAEEAILELEAVSYSKGKWLSFSDKASL